jgi:hypothetical protein
MLTLAVLAAAPVFWLAPTITVPAAEPLPETVSQPVAEDVEVQETPCRGVTLMEVTLVPPDGDTLGIVLGFSVKGSWVVKVRVVCALCAGLLLSTTDKLKG